MYPVNQNKQGKYVHDDEYYADHDLMYSLASTYCRRYPDEHYFAQCWDD